jgi:hypothetical protein
MIDSRKEKSGLIVRTSSSSPLAIAGICVIFPPHHFLTRRTERFPTLCMFYLAGKYSGRRGFAAC